MTGLTLGRLDLMGGDQTGPYWFKTLGDDLDPGSPAPAEREITSLLMDGSIVAVDSYGNREMTLKVAICAEDAPALAAGEAALMAELRCRNVLVWTPPNGLVDADPCYFDVVNSELTHAFDDVLELRTRQRVFILSIKALPHARSGVLRQVSITAPTGITPTVTTINDCTTTTGWVAGQTLPPGTPVISTSGGSVRVDWSNTSGMGVDPADLYLAVGLSATAPAGAKYVRIDWSFGGTGRTAAQVAFVQLNSRNVEPAFRNGTVAWYPFTGTLTSVQFVSETSVSRFGKMWISVADISFTNIPQDASGNRQTFGTVQVAGSTRTKASIAISDPTAGLGSVLVYTAPNNGPVAQPPLRQYRSGGSAETVDNTLISGKSNDLNAFNTFDIPVNQVPDGTYLLMVRVKNATAGVFPLSWTTRTRMGANDVEGSLVSGSTSLSVPANGWVIRPVELVPLPARRLGSSGMVRISLTGPTGLLLDEAWLFNMDTGSLTWVECGTGTPAVGDVSNRLWIDPPSLDSPVASVMRGTLDDRSDSYSPTSSLSAYDVHEFDAGPMNLFVVTSGSIAMTATASFYARFHSHVVETT